MSLITGLLGDFLPWIIGAAGLIAAWFGYGAVKKREGRKEGRREVVDQSRKTADEAKKRADDVVRTDKRRTAERMRDGGA